MVDYPGSGRVCWWEPVAVTAHGSTNRDDHGDPDTLSHADPDRHRDAHADAPAGGIAR